MARKVLIVDDEKDIVELITYNLKKEGFVTDSAPDGETALAKIKKGNYDLVILDLMLPGLQGIELCRILRNNPATSSLPVIMLTAKGEEVFATARQVQVGRRVAVFDFEVRDSSNRLLAQGQATGICRR